MVESRRLRQWQRELNDICARSGKSLQDICDYLHLSYSRDIGFYVKLPKRRSTFIGIGMALDQGLDTINSWITRYGNKRRLYSKDISEDLIWIYLINSNLKDKDSGRNYFDEYETCLQIAFETYYAVWSDLIAEGPDTFDVDEQLRAIGGGGDYDDLKKFVLNNIDSFKSAYSKPRRMLMEYVRCILATNGKASAKKESDSLISLRGWLDDSMINYLSGSPQTLNTTNMKTGSRGPELKRVPKSRKAHIALALALGMTCGEIDQYLELMGYQLLNEEDPDDQILMAELDRWDEEHPLQRKYKEKFINGNTRIELDEEEEKQAVSDMLMLRQDLRDRYKRRKLKFMYMKG